MNKNAIYKTLSENQLRKVHNNPVLKNMINKNIQSSLSTSPNNINPVAQIIKKIINDFNPENNQNPNNNALLAAYEREAAAEGGKRRTRKTHRKSRKTHRKTHRKSHHKSHHKSHRKTYRK